MMHSQHERVGCGHFPMFLALQSLGWLARARISVVPSLLQFKSRQRMIMSLMFAAIKDRQYNLMSDFQKPHSSHQPLFSSTNSCSLPVQQHPATLILHMESPQPTTPSHRALPLVSLLDVWIARPASSAVTRQARRLASTSKVRPDIEARITAAE